MAEEKEKFDAAFTPDGSSVYSREISRAKRKRMQGETRSLSTRELIDKHEKLLRELRADPNPSHKTLRNISIKAQWIDKLWLDLARSK